jgi:hypothetical protein
MGGNTLLSYRVDKLIVNDSKSAKDAYCLITLSGDVVKVSASDMAVHRERYFSQDGLTVAAAVGASGAVLSAQQLQVGGTSLDRQRVFDSSTALLGGSPATLGSEAFPPDEHTTGHMAIPKGNVPQSTLTLEIVSPKKKRTRGGKKGK